MRGVQELRALQTVTWLEHVEADCIEQAACMLWPAGLRAHSTTLLCRSGSWTPVRADQRRLWACSGPWARTPTAPACRSSPGQVLAPTQRSGHAGAGRPADSDPGGAREDQPDGAGRAAHALPRGHVRLLLRPAGVLPAGAQAEAAAAHPQ